MSCLRDRLICNTALRTAALYCPGGDPSLTLDYNFLLNSGTAITSATLKGPNLTYTGNGGTSMVFDENATLVSTTNDQPRFDHDPVTGAALGLLMEEARTNVALQSEDFSTTWSLSKITIDTNVAVAPDGTTTMDRLNANVDAGNHEVQQSQTVTQDIDHTVSCFVKDDGAGFAYIFWWGADADQIGIVVDLSDGSITQTTTGGDATLVASGVIDVGGGIYRIWVSGIAKVADTSPFILVGLCDTGTPAHVGGRPSFTSLAGEDIFAWGAQLEPGSFPTSYIPTTTVSVTRAKDVCSTTDVGWLNASNGMMFAQGIIPTVSAQERSLMTIDDGGTTDVMRLYMDAAENVNFETVNSGDTDGASDGAAVIAANTVFKCAGTYEDDSVIGYVDGTASTEDTAAGIPVTDAATTLRIGDNSGTTEFNGHLQKAKFYNVTKSASFAQTETT